MKYLILILVIILFPVNIHALDYNELSDNWLTEVYRLNKKLVSTQQELLCTQQELETHVAGEIERDVVISQQQAVITELNRVCDQLQGNIHELTNIIETQQRYELCDTSLSFELGAGTSISGHVEGRLYLGNSAFLFLNSNINYPMLWNWQNSPQVDASGGVGFMIERQK